MSARIGLFSFTTLLVSALGTSFADATTLVVGLALEFVMLENVVLFDEFVF